MTSPQCVTARRWSSAARDGEAPVVPELDAHLSACGDCIRWMGAFDELNRTVRLRSPRPTATARDRIIAAALRAHLPGRGGLGAALLRVSAVGMATAFVLTTVGVLGHSHLSTPEGRDSAALIISLTGGYALAAWRPARLAAGLLPVALLAGLVTAITSVAALADGTTRVAIEFVHVPQLVGAVGVLLSVVPSARRTDPDRRAEPSFARR